MIKTFLLELTPPVLLRVIKTLKAKTRSVNDIQYKIGRYEISLPPQHTLVKFQKNIKLYDRFLPVLARFIEKGQVIVDVGANVGDTAIMMINETKANIVCVEPSDTFFRYLQENVNNLPDEERKKITCMKSLVGEQGIDGELVHHAGTARIEETNLNNIKLKKEKLDDLLSDQLRISLIKVDTDGFDFDVLMSAKKIIGKNKPILFWENQIDTRIQYDGYEKLYEFLSDMNYDYIYIFDNFGNIMLKNVTYEVLKNINDYIFSTSEYGGIKTIYYTDVLAVTKENEKLIQSVIDTYEREWVNVKKPLVQNL